MLTLIWILLATLFVSLLSLVGAVSFSFSEQSLKKLIFVMVGFAAGALMGGALIHLIPESLELGSPDLVFMFVLAGFVLFFLIERLLHWRHCHEHGKCDVHTFTYMSLIGDSVHNFIDGAIIAVSFMVSIPFGLITTVAIVLHEIPQELGDFAVLLHGGFSITKALLFNLLTALTAVLGALIAYFASGAFTTLEKFIVPFAAGGFIYIAASDLIPELHKESDRKKSFASFIFFIVGLLLMFLFKTFLTH